MVVGIFVSVDGFSKVMLAANVERADDKAIYQMEPNLNTLELRLESSVNVYCLFVVFS